MREDFSGEQGREIIFSLGRKEERRKADQRRLSLSDPEHVPDRVKQVIALKIVCQCFDLRESCCWPGYIPQRNCPVELNDWRRGHGKQQIIKRQNLRPIRVLPGLGLCMTGHDRCGSERDARPSTEQTACVSEHAPPRATPARMQAPLESHKTTGDISSEVLSFLSLRQKGLIADALLEPLSRALYLYDEQA